MKENIGTIAGKIWEVLKEKGETNINQLSKIVKEKSAVVHQSLGWLAREDKIEFHKKGDKDFVSLKNNNQDFNSEIFNLGGDNE